MTPAATPTRLDPPTAEDGDGDTAGEITDEELEALALAADPTEDLDADAVPLDLHQRGSLQFLPGWYMPPVVRSTSRRWHRWAIVAVIVAFLAIDAFGLCATFGPLTAA